MRWRQRNVPKSVMHLKLVVLFSKSIDFWGSLDAAAVAVALSSQKLFIYSLALIVFFFRNLYIFIRRAFFSFFKTRLKQEISSHFFSSICFAHWIGFVIYFDRFVPDLDINLIIRKSVCLLIWLMNLILAALILSLQLVISQRRVKVS